MRENNTEYKRIWYVAAIYALGGMALAVYNLQLQYTNDYAGFTPLEFSAARVAIIMAACVFIGLTIPKRISIPSDMFLIFYALFVLLSYIFFSDAALQVDSTTFLSWFAILAFPYMGALIVRRFQWSINLDFIVNREVLLIAAIGIVLVAVVVAITGSGDTGGLSIVDAYERRMIGREIFEAGSFVAYINVMSMNGLNPFLAFLGGFQNRKSLAVLALLFSGVFFYSIGVKAPIALAGLAYVAGLGIRMGKLGALFAAIVAICIVLFGVFLVGYSVSGHSEVGEYFFRRVFVLPGFIVQYYMTLLFDSGGVFWSPWNGVSGDVGVTYVIGAEFFGNAQTNANTNAFVYALAADGFPAYLLTVGFILGFFKILDALHEASANVGYLYLGFLYAILLAEQAATTALVSSGVFLLFGFVLLSGRGWVRDEPKPPPRDLPTIPAPQP